MVVEKSKKPKEKSHICIICPDGKYEMEEINKLSLERAQEIVGGLVQVVPLFNKFKPDPMQSAMSCVVLCDEEGKLKGKPINMRATLEWAKCISLGGDMLVGVVVVIMGPARRSWG